MSIYFLLCVSKEKYADKMQHTPFEVRRWVSWWTQGLCQVSQWGEIHHQHLCLPKMCSQPTALSSPGGVWLRSVCVCRVCFCCLTYGLHLTECVCSALVFWLMVYLWSPGSEEHRRSHLNGSVDWMWNAFQRIPQVFLRRPPPLH